MAHEDASAPLRILLVEDSEHDAVVFRRALRKASAPCHIALCERAEEALEQLSQRASSFDLVVADHRLPGMSGLELFRELRTNNIAIPFVLLTGAGAEHLAVEALKSGVDDYIIKDASRGYIDLLPLVLPEVVQRVQPVRHAAHALARRLRAGTVWVNCYNVIEPSAPFGGYRQSGWGRELGEDAINLYTETKTVVVQL